jgi:PST family polysaccharide transporter
MHFNLSRYIRDLTPNLKKIAGNTGWLFADRMIRMGVGVVVWIWIARYLGPEQFGLLNYSIAFVALISPLAVLGLDNLVIRDVVQNPELKDELLGTAYAMRAAGGVLSFFICLLLILLIRPGETLTHWMVIILAFTSIIQSFDIIDFWFQSNIKAKYTVIAKNSAFLISAAIRVYLILIKAPVIYFAWMILIETLLGAIGMVIFYHSQGNKLVKWRINSDRARKLLKDCLFITLSNSAVLLYMKIDVFILGQMSGEKSVGIYSAATKVSEIFYFFATIIASSVFPVIIGESSFYYQRLKKLFDIMVIVSYLIIIPISFLSPYIIGLFGIKYAASAPVLSVHVWATIFVFLGVAQTSWYIKEGTRGLYIQLKRTIMGAVINIILNIILIPMYNALGAAIATIIAYAYVGYGANLFRKETMGIFKMQTRSLLLLNFIQRKDKTDPQLPQG